MSSNTQAGTQISSAPDTYTVEIDKVSRNEWYSLLENFDDANLYQTWSYDEVRFGRKRISHLVLKLRGRVVAAAQVRLATVPVVGVGIAYVYWGPLWKLKGEEPDIDVFVHVVRAMRDEYAGRRGLLLRIYPVLFDDEASLFLPLLEQEGFRPVDNETPSRTILIDLTRSLDELRKGFDVKWRGHLNRSEKNSLEIVEGTVDDLFEKFIGIYNELLERKKFAIPNDIDEFRTIQEDLPEKFKMKIVLCSFQETLCVGAIMATIGTTAVYLFGATNEVGMKSNGSYMIQWRFIEWLKANHFTSYNLHGINPVTNPGGYVFKSGIRGKQNGKDVHFLGKFETRGSRLSTAAVKCGDLLKSGSKSGKSSIQGLRRMATNCFKRPKQ
jgi:hypothetical protein